MLQHLHHFLFQTLLVTRYTLIDLNMERENCSISNKRMNVYMMTEDPLLVFAHEGCTIQMVVELAVFLPQLKANVLDPLK